MVRKFPVELIVTELTLRLIVVRRSLLIPVVRVTLRACCNSAAEVVLLMPWGRLTLCS